MLAVSLLLLCSVFQVPGVLGSELNTKIDQVQEQLNKVEARLTSTETKLGEIEKKLDALLQFFKIRGTYLYVGPGAYSGSSSEIVQVNSTKVESVPCHTVPRHPIDDICGYTATTTPKGVLLCGGWDGGMVGANYSECHHLNLQTNHWEPHAPLNSKRYLAASVDTPKGWLVMGGNDGSSYVSSSEILVGGKFENSITLPHPVIGHCVVKLNSSSFLLIGGDITEDDGEKSDNRDVYMFDLTGKFTKLTPMIEPRYSHSCALVDNTVVVVGGMGQNFKRHNSMEILSLSSLSWSYGPALPNNSVMGALKYNGQQLLYLDGMNAKYFQLEQDKWVEVGTMGTMRGQFSAVFVDKPSC